MTTAERAAFEDFVAEWTQSDMAYHREAGTLGLGEDSFAWACWQRASRDTGSRVEPYEQIVQKGMAS